jgi:hypothetical protein
MLVAANKLIASDLEGYLKDKGSYRVSSMRSHSAHSSIVLMASVLKCGSLRPAHEKHRRKSPRNDLGIAFNSRRIYIVNYSLSGNVRRVRLHFRRDISSSVRMLIHYD